MFVDGSKWLELMVIGSWMANDMVDVCLKVVDSGLYIIVDSSQYFSMVGGYYNGPFMVHSWFSW